MPEPEAVRSTDPSLVIPTQLVEPGAKGWWRFKLFPDAFEASGSRRWILEQRELGSSGGYSEQPLEFRQGRSQEVANRRAAGRLRRYVVANRLNRLGTLTYASPCRDPKQVSVDVGAFFRRLREVIGRRFPYVWVREWHPSGHGLHVHFLVGRFIHQSTIKEVWGKGIVDIRSRGMRRLGDGAAAEARQQARYLSKYITKAAEEERSPWLHRFEVAQRYQPKCVVVSAPNEHRAIDSLAKRMGGVPQFIWRSSDQQEWLGPLARWLAWDR
jgi:hypothetical protein